MTNETPPTNDPLTRALEEARVERARLYREEVQAAISAALAAHEQEATNDPDKDPTPVDPAEVPAESKWTQAPPTTPQAARDVVEDPQPWDTRTSPFTRDQYARMVAMEAAANVVCPSVDGGRLTLPDELSVQDVTALAQFVLTGEHPDEVQGRMPVMQWIQDMDDDD